MGDSFPAAVRWGSLRSLDPSTPLGAGSFGCAQGRLANAPVPTWVYSLPIRFRSASDPLPIPYGDTSDGLRNSEATVVPSASNVISEISPREITQ
jgi:hypothetical protein